MSNTRRSVTFLGNPLTLTGNDLNVGDKAPDFVVTSNDMKPVKLSDYKGKTVIISAVPSLDTPVCDTETRRFNAEASSFGPDVEVLTISMDLPFAQQRWCGAAGVDRVTTLSDYMSADFGVAYGVLIDELKLLARTVFIVDKSGVIRYKQLVPEIAEEPDYGEILTALKSI
jgi:thioredoxin-dependent peroxiredoxin